jgi:exodeoxyribonuclease VII large subunit
MNRWPEPQALFAPVGQKLDELAARMPRALSSRAAHARADYSAVAPRLRSELLVQRIQRSEETLASLWRLAELAHPDRPLKRGFARITDRVGKTLTRAADAEAAKALRIHFGDGVVEASTGKSDTPARVERAPRRSYIAPQPGLFDDGED